MKTTIECAILITIVVYTVWFWTRLILSVIRFYRHSRACSLACRAMKQCETHEQLEFYKDQADAAIEAMRNERHRL